jgi:hypothetical protein
MLQLESPVDGSLRRQAGRRNSRFHTTFHPGRNCRLIFGAPQANETVGIDQLQRQGSTQHPEHSEFHLYESETRLKDPEKFPDCTAHRQPFALGPKIYTGRLT